MSCVECNLDIFQGVQPHMSVSSVQAAAQPFCNMPLLASCGLCHLLVLEPKHLYYTLDSFYIVTCLRTGEGREEDRTQSSGSLGHISVTHCRSQSFQELPQGLLSCSIFIGPFIKFFFITCLRGLLTAMIMCRAGVSLDPKFWVQVLMQMYYHTQGWF